MGSRYYVCVISKQVLYKLRKFDLFQSEHYVQLLENEKRKVLSLRSSLQTKERKLTEATDKYLQEVVELKKQLECKQNYNKVSIIINTASSVCSIHYMVLVYFDGLI